MTRPGSGRIYGFGVDTATGMVLNRDMNSNDLRTAITNSDIPEGVTGVLTVENDWVDNIDTVTDDSAFWDHADGLTFEWDFTGRDDTADDLARNGQS